MTAIFPIEQNLYLAQGDTPLLAFTITDSSGAAIDLTGATVDMIVKTSPTVADDDVQNAATYAATVVDATAGTITVQTDVAGLGTNYATRYYRILVTDGDDVVTRVLGKIYKLDV